MITNFLYNVVNCFDYGVLKTMEQSAITYEDTTKASFNANICSGMRNNVLILDEYASKYYKEDHKEIFLVKHIVQYSDTTLYPTILTMQIKYNDLDIPACKMMKFIN